jgi:hypothetical protein
MTAYARAEQLFSADSPELVAREPLDQSASVI